MQDLTVEIQWVPDFIKRQRPSPADFLITLLKEPKAAPSAKKLASSPVEDDIDMDRNNMCSEEQVSHVVM